jgi:Tol biopolymer transport system component
MDFRSCLASPLASLVGPALLTVLFVAPGSPAVAAVPEGSEPHLADLRQLTTDGENAEAYWSPDGTELIFQAHGAADACDQIYRLAADGGKPPIRVSSGKGRTTCSYFLRGGERVIFSSTEGSDPQCPPPPDRSHGYVWAVYPTYEIWSTKPDGSDPVRLTTNQAYDAESTVCPTDGTIVFTSNRDGDLELYSMKPDGMDVRRLTHAPGYDGGAFFSPDCKKLVWRAARPMPGKEQQEDAALLKKGLVRPGKLEIWVANADGTEAHQVTALGAASFAPSFFPSGKRLLFSSNVGDPKGREFDLWAIDVNGTRLERITRSPGFDGFPLFSPDGQRLAFSSNRNQKAQGDTNVFVARWVDSPVVPETITDADWIAADVGWLADDAREGRGVGTEGLAVAGRWLAGRFHLAGLEPGFENDGEISSFFQRFDVPISIESGAGTRAALDGVALDAESFRPLGFSASASVAGEVVAAGYGVTAPERGIDDYEGVDAKGKIVAVRRFVAPSAAPAGLPVDTPKEGEETPAQREAREKAADIELRDSDLRYKAFNAKQHGATGMIVVDLPLPSGPIKPTADLPGQMPDEAPLPALSVADAGNAGIPVIAVSRAAGANLFSDGDDRIARAEIAVELTTRTERAMNVVGVLRADAVKDADRLPGAVLIGAHYDHLGFGPFGSLDPDSNSPHNGADDNASGTAALLLAARKLAESNEPLRRDVWFVAFSGEERGVLGSTAFTREPPPGLALADLDAMINMDMVGRLRENKLSVLGAESGEGWAALVEPACKRAGLTCRLSGDGYGPSDHSPFYAAGVPVLHLFTGTHSDYHRPSDDSDKINALGGSQVAGLVADLARTVANRPERVAYKSAPAPAPAGDVRGSGASLGTIPDYAGDGRPGVLLAGARVGSPAEKAGIGRGDLLVELAGTEIRDIQDFMFVLRRATPGQRAPVVVIRDGRRVTLEVEFGVNTRMR